MAIILVMDKLDQHLRPSSKVLYCASIIAAMRLAKNKMNHYYSLMDSSSMYHITMVLHPGLKLEYFWQQNWENFWIVEAEKLTQDEYMCTYENQVDPFEDTLEVQQGSQVCTRCVHATLATNWYWYSWMTLQTLQIFPSVSLKPL